MKWKCTYSPEEEKRVYADLAILLQRHPGAKVRRDKTSVQKACIHLTTCEKKQNGPVGQGKNA